MGGVGWGGGGVGGVGGGGGWGARGGGQGGGGGGGGKMSEFYQIVEFVQVYFPSAVHGQITHWGRVMHICVNKLIIIGSDNGLSPGRRQAIIWTNAGILLIALENVVGKTAAILSRPQCDNELWIDR